LTRTHCQAFLAAHGAATSSGNSTAATRTAGIEGSTKTTATSDALTAVPFGYYIAEGKPICVAVGPLQG
jgi:hypothetical protein